VLVIHFTGGVLDEEGQPRAVAVLAFFGEGDRRSAAVLQQRHVSGVLRLLEKPGGVA